MNEYHCFATWDGVPVTYVIHADSFAAAATEFEEVKAGEDELFKIVKNTD